ncbi:hypothetical protein TNCT6_66660 [Streptomyces sp. 6-11-2]|nr:hypothetical protein TNCT6_66660 [Streptomyces sp. 6-11-2]
MTEVGHLGEDQDPELRVGVRRWRRGHGPGEKESEEYGEDGKGGPSAADQWTHGAPGASEKTAYGTWKALTELRRSE